MQDTNNIELLQECRQIMTKRMRNSITGMLNEIDETLLKMAQDHVGSLDESACYEAVREIRLKRTEIKLRFERRFINLFESEVNLPRGKGDTPVSEKKRESTDFLFEGMNSEEVDTIKKSLGTVRKSCGEVLLELDKKMNGLLEIEESHNPIQPEFVFEAFREACWDIKSGQEVRSMMFSIFEKRISEELQTVYKDINELISKRYTPPEGSESSKIEFRDSQQIDESTILLRYEVITRIEKRLEGHPVPDFVKSFLLKHWRLFLENVYTKYSENSIAWNAARQTMDDLIWSVGDVSSLYERQRLVQLLPSLLFRLLNGMNVIGMSDGDIDKFLKCLKQHQLQSLENGDDELLESITEEARESVSRANPKVYH